MTGECGEPLPKSLGIVTPTSPHAGIVTVTGPSGRD